MSTKECVSPLIIKVSDSFKTNMHMVETLLKTFRIKLVPNSSKKGSLEFPYSRAFK